MTSAPALSRLSQVKDRVFGTQKEKGLLVGYRVDGGLFNFNKLTFQSHQDAACHTIILGDIGSAREVAALEKAMFCVRRGSGMVYVMGQSDQSFTNRFQKVASEATGRSATVIDFSMKKSERFNPLSYMSAAGATEWMSTIFGGMEYFKQLMPVMINGNLTHGDLDIRKVAQVFTFAGLKELSQDGRLSDLDRIHMRELIANISTSAESRFAFDRFSNGFISDSAVFSDKYGHIFNSDSCDPGINMEESLFSRDIILVNLTNSLRSSHDTAMVSTAMSSAISLAVKASFVRDDELSNKHNMINNSIKRKVPVTSIVMDGFSNYMDKSWVIVMSMCRAHNIQVILADEYVPSKDGADITNTAKWNHIDAAANNCLTKMFMKHHDDDCFTYLKHVLNGLHIHRRWSQSDLTGLGPGEAMLVMPGAQGTYKTCFERKAAVAQKIILSKK